MAFVTWDEGNGKVTHSIHGADPKSFVVLKDGYAKDKSQVYFEGRVIWSAIDADKPFWTQPNSFEVLGSGYAKNAEFAYFRGEPFSVDLSSFRVGSNGSWTIDKNDAYVQTRAVHSCDPSSFEHLSDSWYRDAKCVYSIAAWGPKRLSDANPKTFVVINFWFGADERHVYTSDATILRDADPASFRKGGKDAYLCKRVDDPAACYRK